MTQEILFVTGISGAGKSTALKMLEDMGFFCIDNLPIELIEKFVQLTEESKEGRIQRVAIGVDIRSGSRIKDLKELPDKLNRSGIRCRVLYLDADDRTLVKRYKETRRSHPLAGNERVEVGILKEREIISFLKEGADFILDTSQLLTRELKAELDHIFLQDGEFKNLMVTVLSFGFKYGIPADSDLVFDVRFLPNPYYVPELRPQTGRDEPVRDFVMKYEASNQFSDKLEDLVRFLIPNYISEGKNQLVIAVGCTGGKHRSVALAEELYRRLKDDASFGIRIEHRDIQKDAAKQGN